MQTFNFSGYNLLINIVKLTSVNREWVTLSPTSVVRITLINMKSQKLMIVW